jgi:hypothetical protein
MSLDVARIRCKILLPARAGHRPRPALVRGSISAAIKGKMSRMGKEETYREQLERQKPDGEIDEKEIFRPKTHEPAGEEWEPEDKPGGKDAKPTSGSGEGDKGSGESEAA